jgi:hypothetical protein
MPITTDQASLYGDPSVGHAAIADQLFVGPQIEDWDIDGMELSDAAVSLGISSDEIWRRIRNGVLLGRTVQGKVLVYTDLNARDIHDDQSQITVLRAGAVAVDSGLPPIPTSKISTHDHTDFTTHNDSTFLRPLDEEPTRAHPEIMLLIDHLSLAKEENREILRLTQDAMSRLTHMTDVMLDMKDALIASKEEQMSILKLRLSEQSADLIRALKENEDLETLASALQR